jgi:hypothetical protein
MRGTTASQVRIEDRESETLQEGGVVLRFTARSKELTWTVTEHVSGRDFARMADEDSFEEHLTRWLTSLRAENLR